MSRKDKWIILMIIIAIFVGIIELYMNSKKPYIAIPVKPDSIQVVIDTITSNGTSIVKEPVPEHVITEIKLPTIISLPIKKEIKDTVMSYHDSINSMFEHIIGVVDTPKSSPCIGTTNLKGKTVCVGMSTKEVFKLWGYPSIRKKATRRFLVHELFIYNDIRLYFHKDTLALVSSPIR
jgi:hypothetical protein